MNRVEIGRAEVEEREAQVLPVQARAHRVPVNGIEPANHPEF